VNTVSANVKIIARQMTEKSQRKDKFLHCFDKNLMNHFKPIS